MSTLTVLNLIIATPEGKAFEGPIASVTAPGVKGSFAILRGHAPFISALSLGIAKVRSKKATGFYVVEGGFLEVRDNQVMILADLVTACSNEEDAKVMVLRRERERLEAAAAQ